MNDEFFATVKLMTGEEILGYITLYEDGITILNALLLEDMSMFEEVIENVNAKGIRLSKWIKSSTDNVLFIKDDKIVTISELIEPGLTVYKRAVIDLNKNEKKVNRPSRKKEKYGGHKSTVKEARTKFEKLFNDY